MQSAHKRQIVDSFPLLKRVSIGLVLLFFLLTVLLSIKIVRDLRLSPTLLWQVFRNDTSHMQKTEGRTNTLLLGVAGADHEGSSLTDTMIVFSIDPINKDMVLVSIPRDIWMPDLRDKINSAYAYAEAKQQGSGFGEARKAVETVIGVPIHYTVKIDFSGFKKIIDILGGIDVEIAQSFTDPMFPIAGKENDECGGDRTYACRYEIVTFTEGTEHMNGKRALTYVRSRHAEGDNGTDFARSQRQKAVIAAFKKKLVKSATWSNRALITKLLDQMKQTIVTDMSNEELLLLGRAFSSTSDQTRTAVLAQEIKETKGLFRNPPTKEYEGKWVLVPKHQTYDRIHEYFACVIENKSQCEALYD